MTWRIEAGDARAVLAGWPAGSVQCVCTSPPYLNLRDYGVAGQIGMESSIEEYVAALVDVFRAVRRILKPDGTCWINLGDSYSNAGRAGSRGAKRGAGKPGWTAGGALGDKQLLLVPARVALALQADGWVLRNDVIWEKPNAMPSSVKDRLSTSYEHVFLFSKQPRYYYDAEALREPHKEKSLQRMRQEFHTDKQRNYPGAAQTLDPVQFCHPDGRNARDVWTIATEPFSATVQNTRRVYVASGDASGDMTRITSADCPVHGDRPVLVPTAQYDPHGDGSLNHTTNSDAHPVPGLGGGSVPTHPRPAGGYADESSDLPRPPYVSSATDHSSESRKMALGPETNLPYTPSVETVSHTDGMSVLPGFDVPPRYTPSSKTGPGASGDHRSAQTVSRTAHTVSSVIPPECTCTFYHDITEKTSHFAVMPTELARRCILAGSRPGDIVADPFTGAGTVGVVALRHGRGFWGAELNPEYVTMAEQRIVADAPLFNRQEGAA